MRENSDIYWRKSVLDLLVAMIRSERFVCLDNVIDLKQAELDAYNDHSHSGRIDLGHRSFDEDSTGHLPRVDYEMPVCQCVEREHYVFQSHRQHHHHHYSSLRYSNWRCWVRRSTRFLHCRTLNDRYVETLLCECNDAQPIAKVMRSADRKGSMPCRSHHQHRHTRELTWETHNREQFNALTDDSRTSRRRTQQQLAAMDDIEMRIIDSREISI